MRLPNLARWLRTRNAAIASRRAAHAARTKGGLFAKDQTPDGLMAVADEVAETREPVCGHRWGWAEGVTGEHTVPHLCIRTSEHRLHDCICGAWLLALGVRS